MHHFSCMCAQLWIVALRIQRLKLFRTIFDLSLLSTPRSASRQQRSAPPVFAPPICAGFLLGRTSDKVLTVCVSLRLRQLATLRLVPLVSRNKRQRRGSEWRQAGDSSPSLPC